MSTHPGYDPDSQADVAATEADIRTAIDDLVRSALPRAGKTAVARIAKPLTSTLLAFRYTLLEDVGAGYAAWSRIAKRVSDGDREALTVEQIEQRIHAALDLVPPPADPPRLNEVIAGSDRLAEVARTDGVLIKAVGRDGLGGVAVSQDGAWFMPGRGANTQPDLSVRWVVQHVPDGTS